MNLKSGSSHSPIEASPRLSALLERIDAAQLRSWVERISVPRHYAANEEVNQTTARWLADILAGFGYEVEMQGNFWNVVTRPARGERKMLVVGAHYDSLPGTPGADDNGSAVAAMLGCAWACAQWSLDLPVMFVAFNREEDGLLGSTEFVKKLSTEQRARIQCAHILEMVGYTDFRPGSQRVPSGLPIQLPDQGDFLGLVANHLSVPAMDRILTASAGYVPDLPVQGLGLPPGIEFHFPVLLRSDHAPFWEQDIPAVMWTDTSEFRNPHYHKASDTPDTLDYAFLQKVTRALTASVITEAMTLE